jgi:hypothetical protein
MHNGPNRTGAQIAPREQHVPRHPPEDGQDVAPKAVGCRVAVVVPNLAPIMDEPRIDRVDLIRLLPDPLASGLDHVTAPEQALRVYDNARLRAQDQRG